MFKSCPLIAVASAAIAFFASVLFAVDGPDGKVRKLTLGNAAFNVDGKPILLAAGEMHIGRILPEFWETRVKQAKAMGLNTVSIYLFWNQIEPKQGEFDWTGGNDVRRFVKLCQDNGLWVILRAGPYVCAETEFGGFPAWLLKDRGMRIRANDPKFLGHCKRYVEELGKQVADLQVNHGGPILMTQFENEYQNIDAYLRAVHDLFVKAGFDGELMTCDHSSGTNGVWNVAGGIPGVLRGYNGIRTASAGRIEEAKKVIGDMPVFTPEFYTGWFDLWGGPMATVSINQQVSDTQFLIKNNVSFCYYVFNGGTNFGFSAGSNAGRPMQTTYDYDAPVDELGRTTPKFKALREVLGRELKSTPPEAPAEPRVIAIPAMKLSLDASVLGHLPAKSVVSDSVKPMEELDQAYGFIDYRITLPAATSKVKLHLPAARDYVWVSVNGHVVADGLTAPKTPTFDATFSAPAGAIVDILVENMGRTSSPFDQANSRKGLEGNPTLDGVALKGWKIYSISGPADLAPLNGPAPAAPTGPTLYTGNFALAETGETYLDLSNFHFGAVWVNGHNLGRFWDIGSSRSLYLPSVWQRKGENQITVLEAGTPATNPEISGGAKMVVTPVKAIKPYWIDGAGHPLETVPGQGDDGNGLQ